MDEEEKEEHTEHKFSRDTGRVTGGQNDGGRTRATVSVKSQWRLTRKKRMFPPTSFSAFISDTQRR